MRKITFLAIACCFSILASAQISKGSTFLGGSIGYYSRQTKDSNPQFLNNFPETKQTSFSITPQFGMAVKENQIFGLSLNYSANRSEQGNGTTAEKTKGSSYGAGIFYRRYFPIGQRFYLFGNGDIGVRFGNSETTTPTGTTNYVSAKSKLSQASLSVMPGISFAATRKLFVETSFNGLLAFTYSSTTFDLYNQQGIAIRQMEEKSVSVGADANGFNSYFALGLRWILPSKR